MSIEIRQVDPEDDRAIKDFHDVYVTCGRHDSVGFAASPLAELAAVIRRPTEDFAYTAFLALPTEAPTGDLVTGETPPSVAAVREDERLMAATGQARFSAVAISPAGELAGYSAIVVRAADAPGEQWGTLVRRAHRGHGLGYGVKAAAVRLLQRERPEITATITSNALTNEAMVAVNTRLGYQVIEYLGEVQKHL